MASDLSPSDGELTRLVEQYRAGDPAARDRLIDFTYERFLRLTSRMLDQFPRLRRWEETGDVFQEAQARLIAALKAVRPESKDHFLRLAAVQIRRALHDLSRHHFGPRGAAAHHDSNGGTPGGDGTNDPRPAGTPADGPSTLAEWTEFHEAVEALPEDLRTVVDLHFFQGLTHDQAAAELGVDARTVKRRWSRARRLLVERFHGLPPMGDGA
jgi:RNA polymerase sigma factor (sigma-70 family)